LGLNDVEALKDRLHKHLKEIRKLHVYNFGKRGKGENEDDGNELQFSDKEESSSDNEELNKRIA